MATVIVSKTTSCSNNAVVLTQTESLALEEKPVSTENVAQEITSVQKTAVNPPAKIPHIICTRIGTEEDRFPRIIHFLGLKPDYKCFHHAVNCHDGQLYKMNLTLEAADYIAALSWCLFIRPMHEENIVSRMRTPPPEEEKGLEEGEIKEN